MDTVTITTVLLVIFFAIMIAVGIYCRKHSNGVEGFVLGGRKAGPWLTAFAFGTSYFSAVIFVGYAGQFGYNFGLASTWIGLGNAFIGSLLAWVVLGRRTRVMTQHLGSSTMPDFFGMRYASPALKIAASVITFVFLIPYTASLYNGLSRLFEMAYPGIDYSACVIVMAALTAVYVLLGGYMATAINDFIQGIIMLVGIVTVVIAALNNYGGFTSAVEQIATGSTDGWKYVSFFGADPEFLLFVVLLTSLGTWGLPQMVGKFYSIKNEESIKTGTVISTVFAIIVAGGCYFLGGFARLSGVNVDDLGYDAIIPSMLSKLSPVIIGVVIVLVLSASMSTLSSLVLTSGSTVTLDFIAPLKNRFGKKKISEKHKMLLIRLFVVFFIVISSVIAIYQYKEGSFYIAQMMGVSWGALAGAFLAPFLYGLYWKRTTKPAVACSFVFGVGLEVVQFLITIGTINVGGSALLSFVFKNSLYSGVFAMVGGLIIVPVVSLLTQKTRQKNVDEIFGCYNQTKVVDVTDSLGK